MIRDRDISPDEIPELIVTNQIDRNKELNSIISLLNSLRHNSYIAIDGKWGSGKTVFVKQIEYLGGVNCSDPGTQLWLQKSGINQNTIEDFQTNYITFYYNAWENDHHKDPLQSLLFSLIDTFYAYEKLFEKTEAISKKALKSVLVASIKVLTKDIIDLKDISDVETIDDLVKEITTVNDRKDAVSKIINYVLPDDKKLLFIIDELDRCNPTFAMRLLEVIKHYYTNDKVVFLLSTNNTQLMHTVKKYYGTDFDGYGYLNKFYDLVFHLPAISNDDYISRKLKVPNDGYYKHIFPREVSKHLGFSMREMNRYFASIDMVMDYLGQESMFDRGLRNNLTKYVFTPLALGLKIHNIHDYEEFISGRGEAILRSFYESSTALSRFVEKSLSTTGEIKESDSTQRTIDIYKDILLDRNNQTNSDDMFDDKVLQDRFMNVIALISSTAKLDELDESEVKQLADSTE